MYYTSIKEVEAIVGKEASDIRVQNKEVVLTFAGGHMPDPRMKDGAHLCADVRFHIPNWK